MLSGAVEAGSLIMLELTVSPAPLLFVLSAPALIAPAAALLVVVLLEVELAFLEAALSLRELYEGDSQQVGSAPRSIREWRERRAAYAYGFRCRLRHGIPSDAQLLHGR